jgi:uncharacterized protein (DUF983 family)
MPIEITSTTSAERPVWPALLRGWRQVCPSCGEGRLYGRYLKVADTCAGCGTELHHQRADDAPPYFTMFIVAHVVVAGILLLEKRYHPETWVHLALWLPLTLGLSLWLLPRIKGAFIGQQWALRMHGFGRPVAGIDHVEPWSGDSVADGQSQARSQPRLPK